VAILAGYWALMTFVPVSGIGAGSYAKDANLANWIDAQYFSLLRESILPGPRAKRGSFGKVMPMRLGRLQRQSRRAFWASAAPEVSTSELAGWCWTRQTLIEKRAPSRWQRESMIRAARSIGAVRSPSLRGFLSRRRRSSPEQTNDACACGHGRRLRSPHEYVFSSVGIRVRTVRRREIKLLAPMGVLPSTVAPDVVVETMQPGKRSAPLAEKEGRAVTRARTIGRFDQLWDRSKVRKPRLPRERLSQFDTLLRPLTYPFELI
jgi:hypothetical protein